MAEPEATDAVTHPVRTAILSLVEVRGVGKTICPTEAAKAVSKDRWRAVLPDVRAEAVRLAKAGEIMIYRKGKPVDPGAFKGVYRLGLPQSPGAAAEE
ncbi:MAG: DUF3253 domain-containing protein [Pseudomonadota bacterium]